MASLYRSFARLLRLLSIEPIDSAALLALQIPLVLPNEERGSSVAAASPTLNQKGESASVPPPENWSRQ